MKRSALRSYERGRTADSVSLIKTMSGRESSLWESIKRFFGYSKKDSGAIKDKITLPATPPSPQLLSAPWRNSSPLDSSSLTRLKDKVKNYNVQLDGNIFQTKLLLLGPIAAGKSSFFNTIDSIFQERLTQKSPAGNAAGSVTVMHREFKIHSQDSEKTLNFRVCDTCGIGGKESPDLVELNYLVQGNVPDGYTFNHQTPINPSIANFIGEPSLQQKVHCVGFVVNASTAKAQPKDTWQTLNALQRQMNALGIPRVVLLTHIDKLSECLAASGVSDVFKSNDVKKAVNYISEVLRVPRGNVMPVKNYENEGELDDKISCLALQALDRMLGYATDFVVAQQDLLQSKETCHEEA